MARYGPKPRSVEDRFWDHVIPRASDECWEWRGARRVSGYGYLTLTRTPRTWITAHRLSWEMENGPIPEGKCIFHRCDNPPCVNPAHLFLGTRQDNNADRHAKGRSRGGRIGPRTPRKGAANPNARLTEAEVRALDAAVKSGLPYYRAAELFGVSEATVWQIATHRSWTHLWDE